MGGKNKMIERAVHETGGSYLTVLDERDLVN